MIDRFSYFNYSHEFKIKSQTYIKLVSWHWLIVFIIFFSLILLVYSHNMCVIDVWEPNDLSVTICEGTHMKSDFILETYWDFILLLEVKLVKSKS